MRLRLAGLLLTPVLWAPFFGQSGTPAAQIQTFHIRGTIRDTTGAPIRECKVQITFDNAKLSQTVIADDAGIYETDIPLGLYTMTIDALQFRHYRRPEFRVLTPINITLNAMLAHKKVGYVDREYGHNRPPRETASNITYHNGDFFSVPTDDGAPLRLYISYEKRIRTDYSYAFEGESEPPYDDPVFVAYNLFSLRANAVVYDMESRRLEARGNVVVEDESGRRSAAAMNFKIENGRATILP